MDLSFKTDTGRFCFRIGGVVIHEERVLLMTEDRFDFWYLPGGRASLFETSEEALKREIFEELAVAPTIERMLWTTEDLYYFKDWNAKHHDLAFYYLVSLPKESSIYSQESGIATEKFSNEETVLRFKWFDIEGLEEVNLVPHFLKKSLKHIPVHSEHLIINELSQDCAK